MSVWVEVPHVRPPFPEHYADASRALLAATAGQFDATHRLMAEMGMARWPDHADRVEETARLVGADTVSMFLANISYDLTVSIACSTMALATARGPVLARNLDWSPPREIARASCVADTDAGRQAGFLGAYGVVTGLSGRGFALALHAIMAEEPDFDGEPMMLFLRRVLDTAGGFAEAVALCERTRLASAGLIVLVGTRNDERAVVERLPDVHATRRPDGDRPLLLTNHLRALSDPLGVACPRFERLSELSPAVSRDPSDEELLYVLTDGRVTQETTAQHVVMRPAEGKIRAFVPARLLA